MELLITQELEPFPIRRLKSKSERPVGLLNSNYKNVVNCNFNNPNPTSIFSVKQRVKSRQYQLTSSIETLLKVSVFLIVLTVIL
jgi:hypothetical protein